MKLDCHLHTKYSPDSLTSLEDFRRQCLKKKILPIITDHNTIDGALRYKELYKDVIIGEEIKTNRGDLIGIFLNETIPKDTDLLEALDMIKAQGAISYVPHPFDEMRRSAVKVIDFKADVIEVFNSRVIKQQYNRMSEDFAVKNNWIKSVGSDAHLPSEIGTSYIEIEEFNSPKEFLKNLKKAKLTKRPSPIYVHAVTKVVKPLKKYVL